MAVTLNYYETLYVTRPDLTDDDLVKIQQKLLDSISSNQGEVIRDDKWAERDLAYEIQDHKRGIYYILVFKALPEASKQVEKHLQFYNTDVLRFMTLKITEEAANKNKATQEETTPKTEPAAAPPKAEPKPTVSATKPAAETAVAPTSTPEGGGAQ
jgi:small subunit ribosomal protein S6